MRYHDFLLSFVVVASLFSCSKDIDEESFHQSILETRAIYELMLFSVIFIIM